MGLKHASRFSKARMTRNNDWNLQVAARLRSVRRQKGWSLDVASENTNVSKAMLGQIERGESSPTVTTLWKLATGFGLPFSALVPVDDAPGQGQEKILSADCEMEVTPIFAKKNGVNLEVFKIRLLGPRVQKSQPHTANSVEHIIVLEGSMKVYCNKKWRRLDRDDALQFRADQPHRYAAISKTAIFHNIIYYG